MIRISGRLEVDYDLTFNHKFNIFHTRTAEGKTYVFNDIIGDDTINRYYTYLSANNLGTLNNLLSRTPKNNEIIIMDDFEVICDRHVEVLQYLLKYDNINIVCSLKKLWKCEQILLQDCGFYCLKLESNTLFAKELWSC